VSFQHLRVIEAQELAAGKTADAAYVLAGYRENRSNAARLNASQDIQKRVAEIQSVGAERAAVTVETLIAEAEEARSKAMGDKGGAAAAVAAITVKAKLAGLWRDKVAVTDPSGERGPRSDITNQLCHLFPIQLFFDHITSRTNNQHYTMRPPSKQTTYTLHARLRVQ
jgi:hypothetical protein